MTRQISIPHRDRDESLVDVASNCRTLEGDERNVMREIVLDAAINGMTTAGELCDHLGGLAPAERRAMLDAARETCGLALTADVEAVESMEVASKAGAEVARENSPFQLCHGRTAAGQPCNAMPVNSLGVPVASNARRWHCADHASQAAPGDMDPPPAPWRYSESGAIVENDPAGEARAAAAAESRQRQQQARLEDAQADAAERERYDQAVREQRNREAPAHLRELVR